MSRTPTFVLACGVALLFAATAPRPLSAAGDPQAPAPSPPKTTSAPKASGVTVTPKSGREGTRITITYPSALKAYPNSLEAEFHDPGAHGYHIVDGGGGIYVAYDPTTGLKYTAPAEAVPHKAKHNVYTTIVPVGICGIIITSTQATTTKVPAGVVQGSPLAIDQTMTKYPLKSSGGKRLQVSLVGEKGKPATFSLTCDKYTLSAKVKADPTKVLVPGASGVTATLTVKGPAQVIVGANLTKPAKPTTLLAPLAGEEVYFDTTFGTLTPAPAKVVTGFDGTATVSVSSADPGNAAVRGVAFGIGDARANVEFFKKKKVDPDDTTPVAMNPGPPPAAPDCEADVKNQVQDSLKREAAVLPLDQFAKVYTDALEKAPSVGGCITSRSKRAGGGDVAQANTLQTADAHQQALAAVEGEANAAVKNATTTPTVTTGPPSSPAPPSTSHLKTYALLGGAGAAAAVVALAHGGSSSTDSIGPSTPSTPSVSLQQYSGTYVGPASLKPGGCQGSDPEYTENAAVSVNAAGVGTITLTDNPGFTRQYAITVSSMLAFSGQGSFPFFGAQIPGQLTGTFTSASQLTITETTNWGGCQNTYSASMNKQ